MSGKLDFTSFLFLHTCTWAWHYLVFVIIKSCVATLVLRQPELNIYNVVKIK